jgi:hypothetical protein
MPSRQRPAPEDRIAPKRGRLRNIGESQLRCHFVHLFSVGGVFPRALPRSIPMASQQDLPRTVLPIPDREPQGLTTFDAKDPAPITRRFSR